MQADGLQKSSWALESDLYRTGAGRALQSPPDGGAAGRFCNSPGSPTQLIAMRHNNVRIPMEHALSFATWFWLIVPMSAVVVLSLITYLMGK